MSGQLNVSLGQKIVTQVTNQLGYQVQLTDESGIIIGSQDESCLGKISPGAVEMITNKLERALFMEESANPLTKQGIMMPIVYKDRVIGVMNILGESKELVPLMQVIKLSINTLVEYELYKMQQEIVEEKNFISMLLEDEKIDFEVVRSLAEQLGYCETENRIPIMINFIGNKDLKKISSLILKSCLGHQQDIFHINNNNLIIFKFIPTSSYHKEKNTLISYINKLEKIFENNQQQQYFIGTPQNKYELYRLSFQQLEWLKKHVKTKHEKVYFFTDYIEDYFKNYVNSSIYESIFDCYAKNLDELGKEIFIETVEALLNNNLNINKAASQLYMHRNTIIFRLNKIKNFLEIDPIKNKPDREFLSYFLYYLKKNRLIREFHLEGTNSSLMGLS